MTSGEGEALPRIILDGARGQATVRVDEELDADHLQTLVGELASARARMVPAVPMAPPVIRDARALARAADACGVAAWVDSEGECQFWMRHAGLGWISCVLPVAAMLPLADLFRQATSNCATEPTFFSFDPSKKTDAESP